MLFKVARVNYLRAMAQRDRWREEESLLLSEADWTKRYFLHQAELWRKRADGRSSGHTAYALKMVEMWMTLSESAEDTIDLMRDRRADIVAAFQRGNAVQS